MIKKRTLAWDGCANVRDLGGSSTCNGRVTRWGAVVRSDNPSKLTAAGWSALYAHGIRTIISLRTHGMAEDVHDTVPRPSDLTTVQVAVEDLTDAAFVQHGIGRHHTADGGVSPNQRINLTRFVRRLFDNRWAGMFAGAIDA